MNPSRSAQCARLRRSIRDQQAREAPLEPPPLAHRRPERTMTMQTLFERLSSELAHLGPIYARRHVDHPALAAYPSLPELVARFAVAAEEDKATRSAIVCALLDLHQRKPHRLWAALLVRAFRPMLRKTWKELYGSNREERLALLLIAFHEAIQRVDPHKDPVRIGMYVKQGTRKRVFDKLKKEIDWRNMGFGEDADLELDPRTLERPPLKGSALRSLGLPKGAEADLVATIAQHGALWSLVRREHGSLPKEEQSRIYSRLREHRKRLIAKLRGRCLRQS
jgi:hypothetical protein